MSDASALESLLDPGEPDQPREVTPLASFVRDSGQDRPWVQPLQIAAVLALLANDFPGQWHGGTQIYTSWDLRLRTDPRFVASLPEPDEEKHRLYGVHIIGAIGQDMPWLSCLLDAAGASLYVGPGYCCYQLRGSTVQTEIPELLHYTKFLPWATAQDAANPQ